MADTAQALDDYRLLGRSGLRISPLCLGTMTFGTGWGWGCDRESSRAIFAAYAEAGGNFVDTADVYTHTQSEQYLGEFVNDPAFGGRDRFVISTKYSDNDPEVARGDPNATGTHRKRMVKAVEDSLRRLKTDYLDMLSLHVWDGTTPVDELMRAYDDLVRAGKVLYIGNSDTPAWKLVQLNDYAERHALSRIIATQVEYSLAARAVEREIVPMAIDTGLGLLCWSPLGGGLLTGKYTREHLDAQRQDTRTRPGGAARGVVLSEQKIAIAEAVIAIAESCGATPAQVALRWLLEQTHVSAVLLGARSVEQLQDNLGCLRVILGQEQLARLDAVSRIDLGFPGEFLHRDPGAAHFVSGGTRVRRRIQQPVDFDPA
ncbi:MAG: aldo/keto reductase [Planctomycetota bacterium]